jgi:hypothetical protein
VRCIVRTALRLECLQQALTVTTYCKHNRDFDSANCGHVTPAQFLRQVDSMGAGSISAAAARTLAKAYMNTARGAVNYRALHADVTPVEEPFDDGNLHCHDAGDAGSSAGSVEDFCYDDSASCASSSYTATTVANGYYDSLDELTGAWGDAVSSDAPEVPHQQQQPLEMRLSPLEAKLAAKVRNEFIEVRADMKLHKVYIMTLHYTHILIAGLLVCCCCAQLSCEHSSLCCTNR